MSERLSLTVVMPAFNAAHYLERSLPPLLKLRARGEIDDVIVVDDCSTNPSNLETARRLGATVMQTPRNGGPGAARNYAAARVTSDLLWFVDADVVAHESGPAHIRKAFEDASVTAIFGSYDDRPPAQNFPSQYKNLVHRYYHQRGQAEASTFWAGCGVVRRRAFLAAGGFDRNRFSRPSIEDIELGHRLIDNGGRIRLVHDLLGTHLKDWGMVELLRTDIFQRAIPWSRLILTSPRKDNDLNVAPAEKVRAVIAGLWMASLLSLPLGLLSPVFLAPVAVMTLVMLAANLAIFGFFRSMRGTPFALTALAYHQVYYLYSMGAFAYCVAEIMLRPERGRAPSPPPRLDPVERN